MLRFLSQHWSEALFTLIGALLPFLTKDLVSFGRFVRIQLNPEHHPETALLGCWYAYHLSRRSGRPLMRAETWTMALTWRGSIRIRTHDEKIKDLVYEGTLESIESTHLTCRMHGCRHHEEYYVRILYPIPSHHDTTCGIKVGENFDHDVFATIYLFARDDLSPASARQRLRRVLDQSAARDLNGIVLQPSADGRGPSGGAPPSKRGSRPSA